MGHHGIFQCHAENNVPGTVLLDMDEHEMDARQTPKHSGSVLLVPQPSNDPNDPLNWPTWKKNTIFSIMIYGTMIYACVFGPLLTSSLIVLATEFNVSLASITKLTGEQILVPACSAIFVSAISRKYGMRALFVFSSLFALIGTVIGSCSTNYQSLRAARIIQGLSVTAYESLPFIVIRDLFFVHERGLYIAILSFVLVSVSNFSSVVSGSITRHLGWKYLFHILIAASGLQLLLTVFFIPETTFSRKTAYGIDATTDNTKGRDEAECGVVVEMEDTNDNDSTLSSSHPASTKKKYWQTLGLWSETYSDEKITKLLIAPFAVLSNLAIAYTIILQSWVLALLVAMSYVLAQIFAVPPYNLSTEGIGYLSLGPFIGGLIGMLVLGPLSDPLIKRMARQNGGIYEPEYRLPLGLTGLSIILGLFLFGYVVNAGDSYYLTAAMHGLIMFGTMGAVTSTTSYVLDAYQHMGSEIFIIGMCTKNFLFYGFSYFVNDWLARDGPLVVFYVFGGAALAIMLPLPVMYCFGKKYRSYWSRHDLLKKWDIKTHE